MANQFAVIIPAAGLGKRFAGEADQSGDALEHTSQPAINKIERELAGRPVFLRSIELFAARSDVSQIVVAVNPDAVDAFKFKYEDRLSVYDVSIVAGGRTERWETVQRALDALDDIAPDCTHVAVHDAARPLTSDAVIDRVFRAAARFDAVIPAMPVSGTLKRVTELSLNENGVNSGGADRESADPLDAIFDDAPRESHDAPRVVQETIDRTNVVEVQTPQVFEKALLKRAYARIVAGQVDVKTITDDAGLIELMGHRVAVVEGDVMNLKITRPADLDLAHAIFQAYHRESEIDSAARRLFASDDDDE